MITRRNFPDVEIAELSTKEKQTYMLAVGSLCSEGNKSLLHFKVLFDVQ